jgi:hypothetical protein
MTTVLSITLISGLVLLGWVVIRAVTAPVEREVPGLAASNATWAGYYQRCSYDAHRHHDEVRAVLYGALADRYATRDLNHRRETS